MDPAYSLQEPGPALGASVSPDAAAWFFLNSPDLFVVCDYGGRFLHTNRAWTESLGWTTEELSGRTIPSLTHPDDAAKVREDGVLLRRIGEIRHSVRLQCKSGEWRWVQGITRLTKRGELVGVFRDITEERLLQIELNDYRRTQEMLSDAARVASFTFDPATNRLRLSSQRKALLQSLAGDVDIESVEGFASMVHPEDMAMLDGGIRNAAATGAPGEVSYRLRGWGGSWRRYSLTYRTEPHPTGGFFVHGLSQDITDLVEARDVAIAATEAKSRFLANMSHEIRTPMNGVMGVLQLLRAEPLTENARMLLEEALGCGRMLSELLNDVVDFSKIEEGRLELSPELLSPLDLLESVAGLLRPQAEAKGLWLRIEAQPDLGWAQLDPVRLRQSLFNLIGNAVKFTTQGGVEVRLAAHKGLDGRRLRFEIQDTGPGIADDAQAALFQRFQQADASTTRQFGGSGLGLAITRKLAEMMGGEVGFVSRVGEGSTFWLEVAARRCEEPQLEVPEPVEESPFSVLADLRVLAVDDNAVNRMILSRLLEVMGVVVETAEDGAAAVEAAGRGDFDVILMDVQMPGMDGMEATRRIRALPGAVARTPILAVTADALAHQRGAFETAGMNGLVAKPIVALTLYQSLVTAASGAAQSWEDQTADD